MLASQGRPIGIDLGDRGLNVSQFAQICSQRNGLAASRFRYGAFEEFLADDVDGEPEQLFEFQPNARQSREATTRPLGGEVQQQVDVAIWSCSALRDRPEEPRIARAVPVQHIADRLAVFA